MKIIDSSLERQGIVSKKLKGTVIVETGGQTLACQYPRVAGKRRPQNKSTKKTGQPDPDIDGVAVGDRVICRAGEIVEILPRANQLSRRAPVPMPGAHAGEQVIAANVDQVIPVFSVANPPPHWNLLDRYLVAAADAGIPALVCITKQDLLDDADVPAGETLRTTDEYRELGYSILLTSSSSNAGISDLRRELDGKISVFIGKSGVGKTSLLNALEPGLGMRVQQVSQVTGKGRHTTTSLELFSLSSGGWIIDTPGTREFGLWDIPAGEVDQYFPEFRAYLGTCLFRLDCRHIHEPGCAVRKAVTEGKISPRRYQSYTRLVMDP